MRHLILPAATLALLAGVVWICTWDGLRRGQSVGRIVLCAVVFLLRCWGAGKAIREDRARRTATG